MRVRRFLLLVIALVTAGWLSKHAVWAARCDAELEVVSEPSGWHSWPRTSGLAGYEVTDLEPIHYWADGCTSPRPHGLGKPRLGGRSVCPERGAPLDSWFARWDFYRRSPEELAVYTQPGGDVFVVTGQLDRPVSPQGEEYFVVAFRPDGDGIVELVLRVCGPQDAASVFASRRGVCEGYARLLVELGRLTGNRIEYVTGEVREENGELAPVGHAWNAVEIRGAWYLIDATWDDPSSSEGDVYKTTYLFIPPALAGLDHFPDQADWQLRGEPLRRAEFLRQPLARPSLAREGLALVKPDRQAIEVDDQLEIVLDNPLRRFVMLTLDGQKCGVDDALRLTLGCAVPQRDRLKARLFVNTARHGTYESVAALDVTRR